MSKKIDNSSVEELIIQYLKKNKNFFLDHPNLLDQLNYPNYYQDSKKVVNLNAYRSNKIIKENINTKKQISEILKAGSSHLSSQKRILKTSIKILNTKSLTKLIDLIVSDLGTLLACDLVNCYFTSKIIEHKLINQIDNKIASNFFRDRPQTYLNQNPKGLKIFFPDKYKMIKSYILLKIVYNSERFILAIGSKNPQKFTKDQKVDLIEYLIQVIQIKLTQF